MRIAFCTSLRARSLARDWDYHVWLLEQTVRSMLAQTGCEVRVVVGCHDVPQALAGDPRLEFVSVACSPPARDNDDMCADKVLKLSVAAERALGLGCEYVVMNDADDLVTNRLGEFVARHRGQNGWYSGSEMFYTYGGRVYRWYDIPGQSAGPCVVLRADLLAFAAPPFSGAWVERIRGGGEARYLELLQRHGLPVVTVAAVGLGHYRAFMHAEGRPLAPLPFPANLVINHHDSTATVSGGVGSYEASASRGRRLRRALGRVRSTLRRLPTLRPMTPALRAEFSVPDDGRIPAAYKQSGSVLWR